MYDIQNIQEEFDVKRGRYFWLFVALVAVFFIYFIVDCFGLFGKKDDSVDDCGCDEGSLVLSTSGI